MYSKVRTVITDRVSSVCPRPGLCTGLFICLHCRHVCGGISAGIRLLLLPPLPAVPGTDHQGVVLIPPALQPRTSGQYASCSGHSLVPVLALPTNPITSTWRWDELPGHRITGTHPVAAKNQNFNRLCIFTLVVMVIVNGERQDGGHLTSRRGSLDGKKLE